MNSVGVIDYGAGNFGSVWNAMSSISDNLVCVTKPADLETCSHILLPGVGAFAASMKKLETMGITDGLLHHVGNLGKHFLGVCVGMQLLATFGREFEEYAGLDLIKGHVEKISVDPVKFPLPHIGWNNVINTGDSPLFESMEENPTFYFVHSYCFIAEDREARAVFCEYGMPVVAALSKGNIHGVQFHPEKSQNNGIQLLKNFISL